MQFLGHYWWAFLCASVVLYVLVIANNLRVVSKMAKIDFDDVQKGISRFIFGAGISVILGLSGTVSGILFIIGAIVAIAKAVH